jgi:hypothetical protein
MDQGDSHGASASQAEHAGNPKALGMGFAPFRGLLGVEFGLRKARMMVLFS